MGRHDGRHGSVNRQFTAHDSRVDGLRCWRQHGRHIGRRNWQACGRIGGVSGHRCCIRRDRLNRNSLCRGGWHSADREQAVDNASFGCVQNLGNWSKCTADDRVGSRRFVADNLFAMQPGQNGFGLLFLPGRHVTAKPGIVNGHRFISYVFDRRIRPFIIDDGLLWRQLSCRDDVRCSCELCGYNITH